MRKAVINNNGEKRKIEKAVRGSQAGRKTKRARERSLQ